ncbi:MAG TPA: hypothetical protein VG602_04435 [Actinomycetota bacterium]|nr:hypothetical protein [Actinomycetota bacterium]
MTRKTGDALLRVVTTAAATPPAAPARPIPRREARWLPTLGVFLLILFVTLGGFLLGGPGEIGDPGKTTLGDPISVSPEVRFRPAEGWVIEEQIADPPQVRLVGDIGALYVITAPARAGAEGLLQEYRTTVLEPQAGQLSVSDPEAVTLPAGPGLRVSYVGTFEGVGTPLVGEITAAVSPQGNGVVFDGWAPEGQFVAVASDVQAMIESAEVA